MFRKVVSSTLAAALLLSSALAAPGAVSAADGGNAEAPLKTWYTKAASSWESEALPLGNGYMGAMVFGGVDKDQILINEKTIWSGGPGANPDYNGGHAGTPEQKHAILQQARNELQAAMTAHSQGQEPYVDENGKVIARNYSVPSSINSLINGGNGNPGLIGTKSNFGAYQELGSIWLQDANAATPSITRIYTAQDHKTSTNENVQKLFDGSKDTKYFADGHAGLSEYVIEWDYFKAFQTNAYALTTGNDSTGRDPKNWTLAASIDGVTFETIDTVTNFQLDGRKATQQFELDKPGTYRYFKLIVTALRGTNAALQMSELEMLMDQSTLPQEREVTGYKRELDLNNAVANVTYSQGGTDFKREYFLNYPDNVMAVRLSASQAGKLNQYITVSSAQQRKTITATGDTITMTGWPNDHNKANAATDFDHTLHFAQQIKVIPQGGTLLAQDGGILVENADSIIILMTAGTNYQQSMDDSFDYFTGVDPLIAVNERLEAAAGKAYSQLRERHLADYKELFDRVKLNLMNATFPVDKPTDALLAGYARTNTQMEDRYLEQLYYQFGRYLLIASSRAGSLPANLQGVWASGTNPPWSSDYHANINVQMNYWLAEQTNLSEANIPLMEFIQSLVPRGEISAKHGYGNDVRGWTAHHEINIWGNTAPATSSAFFSPEDGAWLAQHIWERYQYTMDEAFLRDNYDLLLGAALFWVDNLWEDTRDGSLVANPSYSPEHGPYSLGATEVQSVIWGIFDEVIRASEVLGIESSELEEIKASKSRLAGPQIGLGGQFMEWKDETALDLTGDNGHRHVNHLFALHPGEQVVANRSEEDDKFVEAMKMTLNTRGDGGTGWSKAWKINFWARLQDGDRAQKLVKELLYESTLSNLFDTHPPFQIDGNFGATAGMTELLLQSQGGIIQLLPAIPSKWHTGSVSGLKARGNVEVDLAWEQSNLKSATLKTGTTGPITVRATNISEAVISSGGSPVSFQKVNQDTIVIQAQKDAVYKIGSIPEAAISHNPFEPIQAIAADQLYGNINKGAAALQEAGSDDYALFKNVEFGEEGAEKVLLQVAANPAAQGDPGRVELRLDAPDGELIASVQAYNTGNPAVFRSLSAKLASKVTGTRDLYVSFTRPSYLQSIQFAASPDQGEVTGIEVNGSRLLSLSPTEATHADFSAAVSYSDGSTASDSNDVTWSLGGAYSGVKLDQNGTLTVKAGMKTQNIEIIATSNENPSISRQIQIRLVTGSILTTKLRGIDRSGQSGGTNNGQLVFSNDWVEYIGSNGWLKFSNIDLKNGIEKLAIGYASPNNGTNRNIQLRIAEPGQGDVETATTIATVDISSATGGWQNLKEVSTETVQAASGVKDLYLYWPQGDYNLSYASLITLDAYQPSTNFQEVTFQVDPAEAELSLQDAEGYLYAAGSDGPTFSLPEGTTYIYTASREGYITKTESFTLEETNGTIIITLEVDEAPPTWRDGSSLTATNVGAAQVTLTWSEAEDNVGVTGYRVYRGSELLTTVAGETLSYTVTGLSAGTSYTFKVEAGDAAGNWSTNGPNRAVTTSSGSGGGDNGGGTVNVTPTPAPTAAPNKIKAPVPTLNAEGHAAIVIDRDTYAKAANFADDIYIEVPSVDGAAGYDVALPVEAVVAGNKERTIEIATAFGTVTVHSAMLEVNELQGAQLVTLSIKRAGIDGLNTADRANVGDRPVLDIALKVDGVVKPWNNPDAPVTLFIPYSPSLAELAAPEHIVVWFIDDNGMIIPVPSGKYDAELGGVTFRTTHFSKYAVAFVTKTFGDIGKYEWARKAIEVMASRGVISGTSASTFAPGADIKRADFMLLLVKALGLTASVGADKSFDDVNPEAYYAEALAIAKQHGIAQGVGGNRFDPEAPITRQDMMVLLDRALAMARKELVEGSAADLDAFADKESVASYARQSVATLVKNGLVMGNGKGINPVGKATRAEIAVLIYRIYNL
jgi:hypothetical protein